MDFKRNRYVYYIGLTPEGEPDLDRNGGVIFAQLYATRAEARAHYCEVRRVEIKPYCKSAWKW